jgi:hypothetical protein
VGPGAARRSPETSCDTCISWAKTLLFSMTEYTLLRTLQAPPKIVRRHQFVLQKTFPRGRMVKPG